MANRNPGEFPEDLGTGIPPIGGKSMYELVGVGRELMTSGTRLEDLAAGQTFHYLHASYRYTLTVLEGNGFSKWMGRAMPLVLMERVNDVGEVLDSSGGIFLGVTLTGDGNFPMLYLPPDGSEYIPFILETLPTPDEPNSGVVRILGRE